MPFLLPQQRLRELGRDLLVNVDHPVYHASMLFTTGAGWVDRGRTLASSAALMVQNHVSLRRLAVQHVEALDGEFLQAVMCFWGASSGTAAHYAAGLVVEPYEMTAHPRSQIPPLLSVTLSAQVRTAKSPNRGQASSRAVFMKTRRTKF
jgi:hypothetical protein